MGAGADATGGDAVVQSHTPGSFTADPTVSSRPVPSYFDPPPLAKRARLDDSVDNGSDISEFNTSTNSMSTAETSIRETSGDEVYPDSFGEGGEYEAFGMLDEDKMEYVYY